MRILGLDPGLVHTGWGVIESVQNRLRYVASGRINPPTDLLLPERLAFLDTALAEILTTYQPDCAAVEETFVNMNAASTLKLGQARGVVLLAPARAGLPVGEYGANRVKKSVVGVGHATKDQVLLMVQTLLNLKGQSFGSADAADALAVAICHAHHASLPRLMKEVS